jgi:hypothetical protein
MSLKEKIFAAKDHATGTIEVPEWGVTLHLKSWTGKERKKLQKLRNDPDQMYDAVLLTVLDEEGNPVFTKDDLPKLLEKNSAILERIVLAATQHNGVTQAQVDAAKNG